MPINYHKYLEPAGEVGLWRIEEPESWFRERIDLSPEEKAQLEPIKGHRRLEWWAARKLIHQMSGRLQRGAFIKDDFGKPHLQGSGWHISISHSREFAAAIAAPFPVGVDIQHIVPKIERLAHKFLCPEEAQHLVEGPARIEQLHVYWGAKEALYKAYGKRELDFAEHIRLLPFRYRPGSESVSGYVKKGRTESWFDISYEKRGDHMLVYAEARTQF